MTERDFLEMEVWLWLKTRHAEIEGSPKVGCLSYAVAELSTGRKHPRVGLGHDFAGFWRVGTTGFIVFLLIISYTISWFLNRYGY